MELNSSIEKLIVQKNLLIVSVLKEWNNIDYKLKKLENCNLKDFLANLSTNEDQNIMKIENLGKKFWGGLTNNERNIILQFYLLKKGVILKSNNSGIVRKLHETLISLISVSIKSRPFLKNNLAILNNDLNEYSRALKDLDILLSLIDKENFVLVIENEKKLDIKLRQKVLNIIDDSNSNTFKQNFIKKYFISVRKIAASGLIALILLTGTINQVSATDPAKLDNSTSISLIRETFKPIFPVNMTNPNNIISALFGSRLMRIDNIAHNRNHNGIDISCAAGTEVYSMAEGIISEIGNKPKGHGVYIIIDHGNIKSLYAHLSKVQVKKNDKVKQGEIIALSGNSGISSGAHLHFEIQLNNKAIDPTPFFKREILQTIRLKPTIMTAQETAYKKYQENIASVQLSQK